MNREDVTKCLIGISLALLIGICSCVYQYKEDVLTVEDVEAMQENTKDAQKQFETLKKKMR